MKKLTILLFLLVSAAAITAAETENEFVIFSLKGKAQYKTTAKQKDWQAAATRTGFVKGSMLLVEKDGEVTLLYKKYKTMVLTAGTYKIDNLVKEAEKAKPAESTTYLEFIWKEFNKKHKTADSYHKEYLQTKGGVDRSGCTRPLMLTPAYGEKVVGESLTLTWAQDSGTETYTVVFYQDEYENIKLLELDVTGNSLTLSAQTFWIREGKNYFWVAYPKGKPNCARFSFSIVKTEVANKYYAEIENIVDSIGLNPIKAIMAAKKMEDEGYMAMAGRYFEIALAISDNADEYRILYSGFLARAGRIKEANDFWM